jgi:hypothetical protein
MTVKPPAAPPAKIKTPQAIVKLQNNHSKERRGVMSISGREVVLWPGEVKSVRVARAHADWLIANVPDLSVLAIRDVA